MEKHASGYLHSNGLTLLACLSRLDCFGNLYNVCIDFVLPQHVNAIGGSCCYGDRIISRSLWSSVIVGA